jgi:hypothetical protein
MRDLVVLRCAFLVQEIMRTDREVLGAAVLLPEFDFLLLAAIFLDFSVWNTRNKITRQIRFDCDP